MNKDLAIYIPQATSTQFKESLLRIKSIIAIHKSLYHTTYIQERNKLIQEANHLKVQDILDLEDTITDLLNVYPCIDTLKKAIEMLSVQYDA